MSDYSLDSFLEAAAQDLAYELLDNDNIDGTMRKIDLLVSRSEKKDELVDDLVINLAGAEKYETAMACGIKYQRLDSDACKDAISTFAENSPGKAYVFACSNNLESIAKLALEELNGANSEILLDAYKTCCEKNIGLKDFVDALHETMLEQYGCGKDYLRTAFEHNETNLARHIANDFQCFSDYFKPVLRENDDIDARMDLIDFLARNAEEKGFAESIVSELIGRGEYETAIKCCEAYGLRLDKSDDYCVIAEFAANDPGEAYIYGKAHNVKELSEKALELLKDWDAECIIEDLLETYERCCKLFYENREETCEEDLSDFADELHDKIIGSEYFGEFCNIAAEYNEPGLSYWIAHHLLENEDKFDDFDEWMENTYCFAQIADADDVISVLEGNMDELEECDKKIDKLAELVEKVKFLGKKVEKHYKIEIPHLKNIRFKKPTGSYGQISIHGMMLKQAVGV